MKTLFAFAILTFPAIATANMAIKGIEIGQPASQAALAAAFGAHGCLPAAAPRGGLPVRFRACEGSTMVEGREATAQIFLDSAGRVSAVHLAFDEASAIAIIDRAARAKYGTPAGVEAHISQNGFGATLAMGSTVWDAAGGDRAVLYAYGTGCELRLESASYQAAQAAKADAAKQASTL